MTDSELGQIRHDARGILEREVAMELQPVGGAWNGVPCCRHALASYPFVMLYPLTTAELPMGQAPRRSPAIANETTAVWVPDPLARVLRLHRRNWHATPAASRSAMATRR